MSCFKPLQALSAGFLPNGKKNIVFVKDRDVHLDPNFLPIPCGRCLGCRLERSRQWAIRCVHESKSHEDNCFITLTYDDDHLPAGRNLCLRDFQLFMKRLRKFLYPKKIRFFACGEYGEITNRPHYHALIFGYDFPDKKKIKVINGNPIYSSSILSSLWGLDGVTFGYASIGALTFDSAAYVARYVLKKKLVRSRGYHILTSTSIQEKFYLQGIRSM